MWAQLYDKCVCIVSYLDPVSILCVCVCGVCVFGEGWSFKPLHVLVNPSSLCVKTPPRAARPFLLTCFFTHFVCVCVCVCVCVVCERCIYSM